MFSFLFPLKIIIGGGILPSAITVSTTVICLLSAPVVRTITSHTPILPTVLFGTMTNTWGFYPRFQSNTVGISAVFILSLLERRRQRAWPLTVQEDFVTLMS